MTDPGATQGAWHRQYYEPGGEDACLFYVVFGLINADAPLSSFAYRCEGIPDGLKVTAYGPSTHPEVVCSFREGYLWEQLQQKDPELAATVSSQQACITLSGTFRDPETLDYLRNTIGLITHSLDNGGVAVYDPQMFAWWSPKKWKERVFHPAAPVPRHHTIILVSEEAKGTVWIHT